jgi:nucleoside-diphosphate-sugar epimerase
LVAVNQKIVVTGAAGLVGQNLLPRLKARGYRNIVAIDKHPANTATLRMLHPDVQIIQADLSVPGDWQENAADAGIVVTLHAQIGGLDPSDFVANNITATQLLIEAVRQARPHLIHVSSSVVESQADDWYTDSKEKQERLVLDSGLPCVVLRPTLMFGWFDRKHLGWLARFMRRTPLFPIPGNGRYLRQPLYAGDFCNILMACIEHRIEGQIYNISGLEKIDYIDMMRAVRGAAGASTAIVRIPYSLFWLLLRIYALFDHDPPFTTRQLEALVTPDVFDVIDWPTIFGVQPTPLRAALKETFCDPVYSKIVLEF